MQRSNGVAIARPVVLGLARVLSLSFAAAYAAPLTQLEHYHDDEPEAEGGNLLVLYITSLILVLLGGAFAGLTIALMGQDGIYLQVLARDKFDPQQKNAKRVYKLLQKGKHWVLVTLLLSNVIVNETLPVVLDRCLGGGIAAVVGSTFLIVIFGEILPQSVCVRYGLPIGGFMARPVLILMWILAPIAWPTAKLLDWLLGEDHGTVYKKSGLKTLVTLHKSLGEAGERLNQDEVTIISAVLDLKEKPVESVMTPMADVFVMSEDTVLDEETMDLILSAGYSRIPIHEPDNPTNFVGMLLVKILITYDPEDCKLVKDFPLATLPETRPETSCLDIVNFFQEGKSHMVLVSEYPGEDHGALGVVTLEDVIEELIGEEIIDESDVYIDVHKAIRRLTPAPKARIIQRTASVDQTVKGSDDTVVADEDDITGQSARHKRVGSVGARTDAPPLSTSPRSATFMMRRSSAGADGQTLRTTVPVRGNIADMREHLRHLGPSNRATNPRGTRLSTVKVKPGLSAQRPGSISADAIEESVPMRRSETTESTSLLRPTISGKDGIEALRQSYGSVSQDTVRLRSPESRGPTITVEIEPESSHVEIDSVDHATQTLAATSPNSPIGNGDHRKLLRQVSSDNSSVRSLPSDYGTSVKTPRNVRSGSITENIIESKGVRKVVLETTSSNDDEEFVIRASPTGSSPRQLHSQSRSSLLSAALEAAGDEEDEGGNGTPSATEVAESGPSEGGDGASGGGGGKKKNRRKKRRGGKS